MSAGTLVAVSATCSRCHFLQDIPEQCFLWFGTGRLKKKKPGQGTPAESCTIVRSCLVLLHMHPKACNLFHDHSVQHFQHDTVISFEIKWIRIRGTFDSSLVFAHSIVAMSLYKLLFPSEIFYPTVWSAFLILSAMTCVCWLNNSCLDIRPCRHHFFCLFVHAYLCRSVYVWAIATGAGGRLEVRQSWLFKPRGSPSVELIVLLPRNFQA